MYSNWVTFEQNFVYAGTWLGSEATWNTSFNSVSQGSWYIKNVLGLTNVTAHELIAKADALDCAHANADDSDLEPFFSKGGKFFHRHGMSDSVVSPGASVYYHDKARYVASQKGIDITENYQLYLIPGLE